jgi:hypothetical protein
MDGDLSLFDETKAALLLYVFFTNPLFADLCVIWVALTYLTPNLRSVFYLGIQGPKGTGKTALLEVLADLAWNAKLRPKPSESVTARDSLGHTLFLDEIDELREETRDAVYGVLRIGYRRGGVYARTDVRNNMQTVETPVYGGKAYTFRGNIEDALRDRTFPVSMQKADDAVLYTMLNKTRDLSKLRKKWERWGARAVKHWTTKRLDETMTDPAFLLRVRAAVGPNGSPRDAETVIDLFLAGRALGVPDSDMNALGTFCREYRESLDSTDELVMLRESITAVSRDPSVIAAGCVHAEAVRKVFNLNRGNMGDKPVGPFIFRRILRDFGLRDEEDVYRLATGIDPDRPTVIRLDAPALKRTILSATGDTRDTTSGGIGVNAD